MHEITEPWFQPGPIGRGEIEMGLEVPGVDFRTPEFLNFFREPHLNPDFFGEITRLYDVHRKMARVNGKGGLHGIPKGLFISRKNAGEFHGPSINAARGNNVCLDRCA